MPILYQHTRNELIIPTIGKLLVDELVIVPELQSWENEIEMKKPNSGYIPFQIPQQDLDVILETVETKKRLKELEDKTSKLEDKAGKILTPPDSPETLNKIRELIKRRNYLEAYAVVNGYRVDTLSPLGDDLFTEFYCALRDNDKNKALDLVARYGMTKGLDRGLVVRLEARYLHKLEREGRILPASAAKSSS